MREGARRTIGVVGEPGIGKTVLLGQVHELLDASGFSVARAKADSIERDRPFGVVRRALDATVDGSRPAIEIADLRFSDGDVRFRGLVEVPEQRFRVIDRIVDTVDRLAQAGPFALVIDDLHWADPGSIDTLVALGERLHDRPLLIVVATRPTPMDERLERFLAGVRPADRIDLGPLDERGVVELLTVQLGRGPTADELELAARAGGNPLFVTTLVATARAGDGPAVGSQLDLPESVRRLVRTQLHDFETDTRRLLELAAVIGGPFAPADLAALSGLPLGAVAGHVERALRAGLLVDDPRGLRFRHDLVADVVYDDIPSTIRSSLHLAIGRHLVASAASPADAAEHFVRGARPGDVEAATVLRRAAGEIGRVAPVVASRLLERAVEVLPDRHPDLGPTVVALARSYVFANRLEASVELVEERLGDGLPRRLEIDLRNARTQVFFLRGAPRRASGELDVIASLVRGDAREPVVLADAAVSALFAVDLDRARARAEESLVTADAHGDTEAPPLALGVLSWLTALGGDLEGGVALAAEAVARAGHAEGLDGHRRIPHLFHAQCLLWADRPEEALVSLRRGRRISAELGMGWDEPMYHALAADERIRAGAWDDALAEAEAGMARSAEVGATFADSWLHLHRARVYLAQDEPGVAARELDRAMEGVAGRGGQGVDQVWWLRALLLAGSDPSSAMAVLDELWTKLDALGVVLRQLELAPDVVAVALRADRPDLAAAVTDRVRALADRHPSLLAERATAWCDGLSTGDAKELRRAAVLGRRAGLVNVAAQGAAADLGTGGRSATGASTAAPAHTGRPPSGWDSLTASERRVVELVGEGLTNSEIAEALNLSRRTVESHLYHSYPKLGLSSRIELVLHVNRRRALDEDVGLSPSGFQ